MSDEMLAWIIDLGVEVRFSQSRSDLTTPGLHLSNPTLADLMCACYDAAMSGVKVVFVYLKPLE